MKTEPLHCLIIESGVILYKYLRWTAKTWGLSQSFCFFYARIFSHGKQGATKWWLSQCSLKEETTKLKREDSRRCNRATLLHFLNLVVFIKICWTLQSNLFGEMSWSYRDSVCSGWAFICGCVYVCVVLPWECFFHPDRRLSSIIRTDYPCCFLGPFIASFGSRAQRDKTLHHNLNKSPPCVWL